MRKLHFLLSVLLAILHQVAAIVAGGSGRDLVLTPKQTLQLNGKRLYYEEQPAGAADRSWEHTLKHVTYVTLFTDAAVGAAAGNLSSQLHDYHDFLQTPFVAARAHAQAAQSRFGDIVTLATGRLEQLASNGSYRFVEGSAEPSNQLALDQGIQTRALWRVQRIRHRDGGDGNLPHRYHYEMKFSVSPLTPNIGWPPQSFIQKESDYPQSFSRVVYEEKREQAFAQRRQDRQPQATFVRGIFQPPPPPLANLNIGEYLKGDGAAKGSPKIELFPGLFNLGLRPNYIPATTFRPSYPPIKYGPRPELTTPLERFPLPNDLSSNGAGGVVAGAAPAAVGAPVTHHFHHHFYMTPAGGLNEAELGYRPPSYGAEFTTPATTTPMPSHHHHEVQFPTNHASASIESLETGDDVHEDQPGYARPPQLYTVYKQPSKYQTSKLAPLLIYAGSGADEPQKTFVRSEPLEETVYRYSEPDPLYVHQHPVDVLQLETPHSSESDEPPQQTQTHPQTNDESGQLLEQEDEQRRHTEAETEQRPAGSQKLPNVASTAETAAPSPPPTTTTTTTAATTTTTTAATTTPATANKMSFVSSSTSITPLRAFSRYRTTPRITAGRSTTTTTTTTETPSFSKWKQRRKDNATANNVDSKAKSSHRHESKIAYSSTTELPTLPATNSISSSSSSSTTTTTTSSSSSSSSSAASSSSTTEQPASSTPPVARPVTGGEVIEVLTQKSVSKSVSIKVGKNGEEIPIIIDDDENEVKRS